MGSYKKYIPTVVVCILTTAVVNRIAAKNATVNKAVNG
jgi:hypothetical protein